MSPALSVGRHILAAHRSGLSSLARAVTAICVRIVRVRAVSVGVPGAVVSACHIAGRLWWAGWIARLRWGEPGTVTGGVRVARPARVEIVTGWVGGRIGCRWWRRGVPAAVLSRPAGGGIRSHRLPWRFRVAGARGSGVAPIPDVRPRPVLGIPGSVTARGSGWGAVHIAAVGVPGGPARRHPRPGRPGRPRRGAPGGGGGAG